MNATVEYVKGHPNNPMSFDEVADKFRNCARFGRPDWNNQYELNCGTDLLLIGIGYRV